MKLWRVSRLSRTSGFKQFFKFKPIQIIFSSLLNNVSANELLPLICHFFSMWLVIFNKLYQITIEYKLSPHCSHIQIASSCYMLKNMLISCSPIFCIVTGSFALLAGGACWSCSATGVSFVPSPYKEFCPLSSSPQMKGFWSVTSL